MYGMLAWMIGDLRVIVVCLLCVRYGLDIVGSLVELSVVKKDGISTERPSENVRSKEGGHE